VPGTEIGEVLHDVLTAASVLGRRFGLPLLEGVTGGEGGLRGSLHELQRLDLVREGLARLATEDRSSWSAAARTDRVLELRYTQERLDAEGIRAGGGWGAA